MSHDLQVMNTYYTAKRDIGHGTWTNIPRAHNEPGAPSMLDVIVCSSSLHKRIKNCTVVEDGLKSDHRAICIDVVTTSIKVKDNSLANTGSTDWKKIMTEMEFKRCYNENVLALTSETMDYDDFNTALLDAGKATTVTIKDRCQGWYAFS
jgi:hypothetical protein